MTTVAENIQRIRTDHNMTQDELADKLHVTRQAISNWETGKNTPDIETLDRLAAVFGTDITEIIYGDKKEIYPERLEYTKYQRKYIVKLIITLTSLILIFLINAFILPLSGHYVLTPDSHWNNNQIAYIFLKYIFVPFGYSFALGFAIIAAFSIFCSCTVNRSKLWSISAILMLIPIFIVFVGSIIQYAIGIDSWLVWVRLLLDHKILNVIIKVILPFASGIMFCLSQNQKKEN